jgi:DNA-binding MarR family transcriptional regulator
MLSPPTHAVTSLGTELMRHARLLHVVRSHLTSFAPHGLDGAAVALLMQLVKCGPRRQGELAEVALLDPSTVSRYVGQLVRRGLVERRPDPGDGRAVQLVATDAGEAAAAVMINRRNEIFAMVLQGWDQADLDALTALITRLNDDVESHRELFRLGVPSNPNPLSGPLTDHHSDPPSGPLPDHRPEET